MVESIPSETPRRHGAVDFGVAAAARLRGIAFQGPERLGLQTGAISRRMASPLG